MTQIQQSISAQAVEPSLSRAVFNMAQGMEDVIDLTLGDPDLPPTEAARRAACDAVMRGDTRYSANAGMPELRREISRVTEVEYGLSYDPEAEVIVTVGGMGALSLAFNAIVNPGDEVIVPAPYYVNYVQMLNMIGARAVAVESDPRTGVAVDPAAVASAVTGRTVALVVNSPCNPTGAALPGPVLDELAGLACERGLAVVSDEVYRTLLYGGRGHESIATRPGMGERTVVVDSASKRFAMTGYRLGYALGPSGVIGDMVKMQENVSACAPLPSQHAALAAYRECAGDSSLRDEFERRRDLLCGALSGVPGLRFREPDGAFYLFVDVSGTGLDGMAFALALLEEERVAVVPGAAYGSAYAGFVRIAYTVDCGRLAEAAGRIARFAARRVRGEEAA